MLLMVTSVRILSMPITTINSRGMHCLTVFMKVKSELKKLVSGQLLEVTGDNYALLDDLTAFIKNQEARTLDIQKTDGWFRVLITKQN